MAVMDAQNFNDGELALAPVEVRETAINNSQLPEAPAAAITQQQSKISVRLVEPRDRDALQTLLQRQHAYTVFRDQPFSFSKFTRNFNHVLARPPRMIGMVAELAEVSANQITKRLMCGAWASADFYRLSHSPLFVSVQGIAVEMETIGPIRRAKAFLALVAGLRQWAGSLNASHSFIHVTTGSNLAAIDRLMKAAGARESGGAYVV
jgi:hypothetical protein